MHTIKNATRLKHKHKNLSHSFQLCRALYRTEYHVNNLIPEIHTSFRFLALNKMQAFTLEREVPDASYIEQSETGSYVGSVLLTEFNIDDINDFYVRQKVSLEACDILVSVVSELNYSTIDVLPVVNRMLKYIDCKLRFSFNTV